MASTFQIKKHRIMYKKEIAALRALGWGNDMIYQRLVGIIGLYGQAFYGHKATKSEKQRLRRIWKRVIETN